MSCSFLPSYVFCLRFSKGPVPKTSANTWALFAGLWLWGCVWCTSVTSSRSCMQGPVRPGPRLRVWGFCHMPQEVTGPGPISCYFLDKPSAQQTHTCWSQTYGHGLSPKITGLGRPGFSGGGQGSSPSSCIKPRPSDSSLPYLRRARVPPPFPETSDPRPQPASSGLRTRLPVPSVSDTWAFLLSVHTSRRTSTLLYPWLLAWAAGGIWGLSRPAPRPPSRTSRGRTRCPPHFSPAHLQTSAQGLLKFKT